jgi:hypothetical protein
MTDYGKIEDRLTKKEFEYFEEISAYYGNDRNEWFRCLTLNFNIGNTNFEETVNILNALIEWDESLKDSYESEPVDKGLIDRGY